MNNDFFTKKESRHANSNLRTLDAATRTGLSKFDAASSNRRHSTLDRNDRKTMGYSSFNTQSTYPRSTGFIDFGLQTERPPFPTNKINEHRFQYLNHFPKNMSTTRPTPQVHFKSQLPRKNDMTMNTFMSETCFDYRLMKSVKKKQ